MQAIETPPEIYTGAECQPNAAVDTTALLGLARLCTDKSSCTLTRSPQAQCCCMELFRHAIVRRDDRAWAAVYCRYEPHVRRWLGPQIEDDAVAAVFERFWVAVDADKFAHFDTVSAVLRYLQLCAFAMRVDHARQVKARGPEQPLDVEAYSAPIDRDMAEAVEKRVDAAAFWRLVSDRLASKREWHLLYLSYVQGLTPRQIRAQYGAQFPDVDEIYCLKRNILQRLRRTPEIHAFWSALHGAPVSVEAGGIAGVM